jgi:hypothetical protein
VYTISRLYLATFCLLLSACAPTLHIDTPPEFAPRKATLIAEQTDRFWWQLHFKLSWPEDESPDFSRHLLIAEQLLLPAISKHEERLPLWRFHRRANRDPAGHQFSLIFFSDAETATSISEQVSNAPLTDWLQNQAMIDKVSFARRSSGELGQLEETSDANWPMEIQRSWPYFIMGVSQAWLVMIQELSREHELAGKVTYPSLLQHYQEVDALLNLQWRESAQHAYLHHLSAVYGYQPIRLRSSELETF